MAAIFKWIFFNENVWILIKISLKFVPKSPINIIPTLVQVMAWHWSGNKPLSEPMMAHNHIYICITWPQWIKQLGHFLCIISFSHVVHYECNILIWTWSNTVDILSTMLLLMAWCFGNKAPVATVLSMHPCISSCLGVKLHQVVKDTHSSPSWASYEASHDCEYLEKNTIW